MSIKDKLLALQSQIPTATVKVVGVGDVHLTGLTAGARDSWEQVVYLSKGKGTTVRDVRASLVVRCIVDEAGARMFSDSEVVQISLMPAKVIDKLYEKCQALSGLGADDVEELEKNLEPAT